MLGCATQAGVSAQLVPDIHELIQLRTNGTGRHEPRQAKEMEWKSRRGEWGGGYEVICTDSVSGTHIRAEHRALSFME